MIEQVEERHREESEECEEYKCDEGWYYWSLNPFLQQILFLRLAREDGPPDRSVRVLTMHTDTTHGTAEVRGLLRLYCLTFDVLKKVISFVMKKYPPTRFCETRPVPTCDCLLIGSLRTPALSPRCTSGFTVITLARKQSEYKFNAVLPGAMRR